MNKFILLVMLLLVSTTVLAASPDDVALKLSLINQDPDPVQPGGYVDVKIRIDNEGQTSAEDVKLTLIESFPFALDPDDSTVISIGTVGSLQKESSGTVAKYRLRVARDAVEGNNPLKIKYSYSGKSPQEAEFDIEVKTLDSGLSIESVSNEALEPGQEGQIELKVLNPSDSTLRDVTIQLDLDSDTLPIAPIGSATSKKISLLTSNSEALFRFGLMPYADADAKVYKVPVTISYYDSFNTLVTKEEIIGVVVGSSAELDVYATTSNFYAESGTGEVGLDLVNKGLIDIKFLSLEIKDSDHYEVISSNKEYIGNIDSDDYETTDITIQKKNSNSEFILEAVVEYKDANNNDYFETIEIPIKLYPGPKKSNTGMIFIVALVVIVGIYFIYKKFKKSSRKKHA